VGIWHSIAEIVHLQVPESITAGTVPGTVPAVVLMSRSSALLDETIRLMRRGKW